MYRDLREFIDKLEEIGELKRVDGVHWKFELQCVAELFKERAGPALLFDRIQGYLPGYRVLANVVLSARRTALALGMDPDTAPMEVIKRWRKVLKDFRPVPPEYVTTAPVFENQATGESVDLLKFPAPWFYPEDGGRYLGTGDIVIMRDPEEGWVNIGVYRIQMHDHKTTGIMMNPGQQGTLIMRRYHEQGKNCPVAVSLGYTADLLYPAQQSLPWGVSEYDLAGFARGAPIDVVEAPLTGLPVPATSEIVLEGEIPPRSVEGRPEGPFAESWGYSMDRARECEVIKVQAVYHRDDPILWAYKDSKPPVTPSVRLPVRAANAWNEMEAAGVPNIKGVYGFIFNDCRLGVVSIKNSYPGHPMQTGMALQASHQGNNSIITIVVDDDVDITNLEEVMWAVASRCDPTTQVLTFRGRTSTIDPRVTPEQRARRDITRGHIIIDACKPLDFKDFPPVYRFSDEMKQEMIRKYHLLEV